MINYRAPEAGQEKEKKYHKEYQFYGYMKKQDYWSWQFFQRYPD